MRKIILKTGEQSAQTKRAPNVFFKCSECKQTKQVNQEGCSTGYGVAHDDSLVCFECCGIRDKRDMIQTGKACLYLSIDGKDPFKSPCGIIADRSGITGQHVISNWPNTLQFKTNWVKRGRHNIAGNRYDFWFTGPDDCEWHGVVIGDNTQVARCRRLKHSATHAANAQYAN